MARENDLIIGHKGWGERTSSRGKEFSGEQTNVHHVIRKDTVAEMLKPPSLLKNVADVDDVPGLPIGGDDHTGLDGLHQFIDPELKKLKRPYRDPLAVRNALAEGYRNAVPPREDLAKLVEAWFDLHTAP